MGACHQGQQHEGRSGTEQDGVRRVAFERAGDGGGGGHHQRKAGDLEQAEQDQVGEDLVARGLVEQAVRRQEGGPVGRFGPRPHGVGHGVEGRGAEHLGPVGVRVDVMAHHLALRGVGVDVAAEERWSEQQREGPDRDHQHDTLHREAVVAVEVTEEPEPDAGEEDEPSKDKRKGGDGRQRGVGAERTEEPSWHPEEPGAREVGLEGLTTEDGTDDDGRRASEPQQRSAGHAQPKPRLRRGIGASTESGDDVKVLVALLDAGSMGASLPAHPRWATAGTKSS